MKHQSNYNVLHIFSVSLLITTVFYLFITFLSSSIQSVIEPNQPIPPSKNLFDMLLSVLFILIPMLNIAFVFLICKDAMISIYIEFRYRTLSQENMIIIQSKHNTPNFELSKVSGQSSSNSAITKEKGIEQFHILSNY